MSRTVCEHRERSVRRLYAAVRPPSNLKENHAYLCDIEEHWPKF